MSWIDVYVSFPYPCFSKVNIPLDWQFVLIFCLGPFILCFHLFAFLSCLFSLKASMSRFGEKHTHFPLLFLLFLPFNPVWQIASCSALPLTGSRLVGPSWGPLLWTLGKEWAVVGRFRMGLIGQLWKPWRPPAPLTHTHTHTHHPHPPTDPLQQSKPAFQLWLLNKPLLYSFQT